MEAYNQCGLCLSQNWKTRDGMARVALMALAVLFVLVCCVGCVTVITLSDSAAPSAQGNVEVDVELARTDSDNVGLAPTPVAIRSGKELKGVGFRVRGRFSNTYTSTKPTGVSSTTVDIPLPPPLPPINIQDNDMLAGDGWLYRGQILLMPGISIGANTVFLAPVFGVQGDVVHLSLTDATDNTPLTSGNGGNFGFPLGLHGEVTIAQWVTPFVTWSYVFNVATWGSGLTTLAGEENITQVGLKLWPGLEGLWLEGGYIWADYGGGYRSPLMFVELDMDVDGPYGGLGYRF